MPLPRVSARGRLLLGAMALAFLTPLALFGWIARSERARALAEAERDAVRTVWVLHEHAARVLETHELVLAEVARQVKARSWESVEADAGLARYLGRIEDELDQVAGLALVDKTGLLRLATPGFPGAAGMRMEGRGSFRSLAEGARGVHVGRARPDLGADRFMFLGRRLEDEAGRFAGVVQVAVPLRHFTDFWERFAPTVAHVILLFRSDGAVITRFPGAAEPERLAPSGTLFAQALARREGVFAAFSPFDGVERIYAFARVGGHPLHVAFGVEKHAALAEWRLRMAALGGFSVLASLAMLATGALALRHYRNQHRLAQGWKTTADRLAEEMAARERAEASLRRAQTLDALGRLTAGVAHDFNNLLQAIGGALALLGRGDRPPEAAKGIAEAGLQAVERGARLVRQLMVFARRDRLDPRPTDPAALVAGMADLLRKAAGPDIRLETEFAGPAGCALADPTQLELAVLNLVINARDALEGRADGVVTIGAAARADGLVELWVADNGPGMEGEVLERALEPFFTTKPVGKGTGLGLSTVHGFAEQSGGAVRIESAPGRGTRVVLTLPRAEPERPGLRHGAAAGERVAEAGAGPAEGAGAVLLVDDDALARLMTATGLRELGHTVVEARDAEEALPLLSRMPGLGAMVTDYAMPGTNGAQLAAAARAARPGLPVILLTGHASDLSERLEGEVDLVLRKPVSALELDARLRAVTRGAAERVR